MKILFLTGQLKSFGGIEKVLSMKVNYLADNLGEDVYLCTYEQGKKPFVFPISCKVHYEDFNINYDVEIHKKGIFTPLNMLKGIRHFFILKQKLKEIDPDVIIVVNGGYDFMFLPFLASDKTLIREIHSSLYKRKDTYSLKEKIYLWMDTFFERKYPFIALLNESEKKFIHNNHAIIIPNPIILDAYKQPQLDSYFAVSAGRICPVKGYDKLILVWKKVVEKIPFAILHIYGIGDPSYINFIKDLIKKKDLQENIILKGGINNLLDVLPNYSLFLSSSLTECFPMVFLEALSCGLPVISFDCPTGPRHIISDGIDGFLAKDQDLEDYSNKVISYFLMTDKKQMSRFAYKKAKTFSIDIIMRQWYQFFNNEQK